MTAPLYFSLYYPLVDLEGRRRLFPTQARATPKTINEIVKARNLGETNVDNARPSSKPPPEKSLADLIKTDGFTAEAIHMACFVGFLALKSGAASVEDVLGDCGLVHEIAHNLQFGEGNEPVVANRGQVVWMARRIERAIPGYAFTSSRP